jgi:hypothetical protein
MKRSTIWIISIILLVILVVYQKVISDFLVPFLGSPYSEFIIIVVVVLIASSEHIAEYFISRNEEQRRKKVAEGYIKEMNNFFKKYTKIFETYEPSIPDSLLHMEDENISRNQIYTEYFSSMFPRISADERNSLILLILIENFRNTNNIEFYDLIQSYNNLVDIPQLTPISKAFLTSFFKFITGNVVENIEDFFAVNNNINYDKTLQYYIENFSKDSIFIYVKENLKRAEELRKTLIELYNKGKLPTLSVGRKAIKNLEEALKIKKIYTKTYVIVGNKFPDKLKNYLSKMPLLKDGATISKNIPSKPDMRFSLYIIKSEEIDSLDDFCRKIKSLVPKNHQIILTVASLDLCNSKTYIFPENAKFTTDEMKICNEVLNYFKTGYYHIDVDIWSILTASDIKIPELLSAIPFNIFVPDIRPKERELIITYYDNIKNNFGVESLEDWKTKSRELESIVNFIASLSLGEYKIPLQRCKEIAQSVIENSKNFSNSLLPIQFDFKRPISIEELVNS